MPIKYLIADDHKIFRQGLKLVLNDDHLLNCIGEAASGIEVMEQLGKEQPDVILLDLKMPDMDGIETTQKIRTLYPDLKILILTMHNDEHFILHLMELGANGYLIKNADAEEIKRAIHSVHENNYYFNELVSTALLRKVSHHKNMDPKFRHSIELNERETEVLKLICEENTAAEIAGKIFLSARTVEGIRASMMQKIGVKNIAGLVIYAVKHGIVK
ncbi:response regulator transcription factor [Taibaiella lutea]|uniref:Response regulator transcription factor n=1 Tax=Taibaiella lutea TaxID=2608001 RepID=A0A5M6CDP0_9BACT|nr:response regulator transcription factor [Taibaiella lutea]KAA5533246.1 response regulator transcription factor [Taibaiella lutea]